MGHSYKKMGEGGSKVQGRRKLNWEAGSLTGKEEVKVGRTRKRK
jgi:hypothetical protein